jgi:tripartite-type tricarboxylate transporter receptor subunit TctC
MNQSFQRRDVLRVAAAGAAVLCGAARAQSWPVKPVTMIVPFPAGGGTDAFARPLSGQFTKIAGQTLVIDNRGGAGGTLGASIAAKAPADGYTLFMGAVHHAIAPSVYPRLDYDIEKDFVPLMLLANVPQVVVINPKRVQANTIQEFIALVKRNPGKFNYGSIGAGGVNHLASAWFNSINGLQMEHVAFKGLPPAVQELMAGRIDAMFAVTGGVAPFLETNKIKALAVSGRNRQPAAPNVPTFAEVGYPTFDASYYFGVVAPKGTPPDISARFARDMSKIINTAEFKSKYLQPLGFEAVGDTPEQFTAFLKTDRELGAQKVKVSGAKLE